MIKPNLSMEAAGKRSWRDIKKILFLVGIERESDIFHDEHYHCGLYGVLNTLRSRHKHQVNIGWLRHIERAKLEAKLWSIAGYAHLYFEAILSCRVCIGYDHFQSRQGNRVFK